MLIGRPAPAGPCQPAGHRPATPAVPCQPAPGQRYGCIHIGRAVSGRPASRVRRSWTPPAAASPGLPE